MTIASITSTLFSLLGYVLLLYMVLVIISYSWMLLAAFRKLTKERQLVKNYEEEENLSYAYSQPVSILVPAYNEESGIVGTVQSLLSLRYPQFEIIVINDGSNDATEQLMIEQFQMKSVSRSVQQLIKAEPLQAIYQSDIHPNLILVTKENGGKADALNAGINISRYPYFCSIDGDSVLDRTSLLRVMKPIMESNREVIASGGNVRIANGFDIQMGQVTTRSLPNSTLVVMQIIEYMRAFLLGRIALSQLNMVLIISGAFSVFSKKWVLQVGGYSRKTVGEDMELVVKLHEEVCNQDEGKEIAFTASPVCWTEAPTTMRDLRTQRRRWHQGLAESLWMHRKMAFNPKYGKVGMLSFPYFLFIELLGPIIEITGYLYMVVSLFMGEVYLLFAGILGLLFLLYGSVFSMTAVLLESWTEKTYPKLSDVVQLLLLSVTEVFWYRPFTLVFRAEGIVRMLRGKKDWGAIHRRGLSKDI